MLLHLPHLPCNLLLPQHWCVTLLTISSVPRLNELLSCAPDLTLPGPGPFSYFPLTMVGFSLLPGSLSAAHIYVWISPVLKISHNHKLSNSITFYYVLKLLMFYFIHKLYKLLFT